jgi:hypothetical protein
MVDELEKLVENELKAVGLHQLMLFYPAYYDATNYDATKFVIFRKLLSFFMFIVNILSKFSKGFRIIFNQSMR